MAISRFLDPKNDFAFRQIFGREKNKDILLDFLNHILDYHGEDMITEVTLLPTIQDPEISAYKQSIVDVLCKDQKGVQFIVEMQVGRHQGFEKRAQLYAAKAYSRQIIKEDEKHQRLAVYAKLKGVIFLAIANFVMFPDKPSWKSTHSILDNETYENDLQDFKFIFLELPKFNKTLDQLENIQEKWMYFFKHADESSLEEMDHLIGADKSIKRAFQAVDQASWNEAELHTYEQMEKTRLDNLAVELQKLEDAETKGLQRGREEGREEGIQIGETKGLQRGREEGREEGIQIGETKGLQRTAINMLKRNMPAQEVADITGLSLDEVLKLKASL